jgi:hypothetical protein
MGMASSVPTNPLSLSKPCGDKYDTENLKVLDPHMLKALMHTALGSSYERKGTTL